MFRDNLIRLATLRRLAPVFRLTVGTCPTSRSRFCEDVDRPFNPFAAYVCGLAQDLNSSKYEFNPEDDERRSVSTASPFQAAVSGVHLCPYMAVIERTSAPVNKFVAPSAEQSGSRS